MENLSLEEANIIKDIRKSFSQERGTKAIKDIWTIFEQEEESYYKPVRVSNFLSPNYIEYKSNCDQNTINWRIS